MDELASQLERVMKANELTEEDLGVLVLSFIDVHHLGPALVAWIEVMQAEGRGAEEDEEDEDLS